MDDLTRPLGQTRTREPSRGLSNVFIRVIAGILSLSLGIFIGWTIFPEDQFGGKPFAVGQVKPAVELVAAKTQAASINVISSAPPSATPPLPAAGGHTVTIIDGGSGRREDFVLPN